MRIPGVKLVDGWVVGATEELSGSLDLEGVRGIADGAFINCTNLTSVRIPSSVTRIGKSVFFGCSGLTNVTIPNSVTDIGYDAFYGCSGLTSVTIPDSVTSIGGYAFYDCSGLTSLTIPDSVTSIGSAAFSGCNGLTSVTIPQRVCSSKLSTVFSDSYQSITNVVISDKVTSIEAYAFSGCGGLMSIAVGADNSMYKSVNGLLLSKDGTALIHGVNGEVVIPNGVTSIGDYAFDCCSGLTGVTIPGSVTNIGNGAFSGCSGLTSVTIPDSVTSIGSGAFDNCSRLTSVTIPDSVTSIGDYVFYNCSGLTSVVIPEGVTSIGGYAFYNCSGLASVVIPEGVTSIGGYAFYDCSGLTSVVIPDSVTSIGGYAFYDCSGLTSITIPEGVTSIGSYMFSGCSGLTSIVIPKSVINIGECAFYGCGGLEEITLPFVGACRGNSRNRKAIFGYIFGTTSYAGGKRTYQEYAPSSTKYYYEEYYIPSKLKKVVITDETYLGYGAFYGCDFLTSVTISDTVMGIGSDAFYECKGLTSMSIPDSVTSIEDEAFRGCVNLMSVTIGNNVKSIWDLAFAGCSRLTSVTIPDSVTSIGAYAFSNCTGLEEVHITDVAKWCGISFGGGAYVSQYGNASANPAYFSHNLYLNGNLVMELTIPDGVTSIGDYAFYNCSELMSVTIPNSVTKLGCSAFSGCSGLTSVAIPDSVTSIGSSAFSGCSGLTSVTIPDSVTSIGSYAFAGCGGLMMVYVSTGDAGRIKQLMQNAGIDVGGVRFIEIHMDSFPEISGDNGVSDALVGAVDVRLGKNIKTEAEYNAFRSWIEAKGIGQKAAKKSPRTWFSYAVGADGLVEKMFEKDDVTIDSPVVASNGALSFEVNVDGLSFGASATAQNLATVFDVQGASSLTDDSFSSENVDVALGVSSDGKLLVRATPKAANGTFFIRVRIHPEDGGEQVGGDPVSAIVTVTFDANGGKGGTSRSVVVGEPIGPLPIVSRDNYAFNNWWTATDGGAQVGASTIVTGDVTYYAHWIADTYTVVYKPGANGSGAQQTATKTYDVPLSLKVALFVRDGYTQTGWTTSDGGAKVYDLGATYTANAAVTLYPFWTAAYTVVYKPGANGIGSQQTAAKVQDIALSLAGELFTRDGYTQTGWATSDVGAKVYDLGAFYSANAAITLYPFWTINKYTVTFDANGGTGGKTVTLDYGTALSAPTVTRDGHTFTGWSPSVPATVPAEDVTYTAQWTINKYTVTFDANGGTGGKTVTLDYGTALSAPTVTRDGHTFTGWSPSVPATVPAGDVTYTAQWTANTYTVTYKPGANGSGAQQTDTKTGGVSLALRGSIFTREGYTQTGWATVDGGAKVYNLSASYMANAAVTLYPYWTANTYTVTYRPGANGIGSQQTVTKKHDVALVLKDALFARDGYAQTGWAVSDGGALAYSLGVKYTTNAAITFYPFWTANTYTVTYKPGANGSGSQQTDKKTGGVALTLRDGIFTRDGYTQTGWATSDGGDKVYDMGAAYTVNAEVTLYPYWTVGTYTVTYAPGVNGSGTQQTDTKTGGVALTLRGSIFTRYCYTQTGWATVDRGAKAYDLGASYTANEAVTLYPYWTANTYTVTYQPGASGSGSMQTAIKTADKTLTLKSAIFTRSGYTQTGWSKSDGGAKAYDLGASYTANASVTLYPFWTVNTYTVTYKPGANGSGSQQTATKTYGVALTLEGAIFTRSGYTQTGWATSDGGAKAYDLGASCTANAAVALYPFWTVNTYTVRLNPGANGSGTPMKGTKTHGVALTLPGAIFTRDGYAQTGWSTIDGGAKAYDLGASYTANASVTLYPFWTVNTYTVTYKPGANGVGSQQTAAKKHDIGLALKDAIFMRDGYVQTGWATSDGGARVYNLRESYTENAAITLYPFWTKDPHEKVQLWEGGPCWATTNIGADKPEESGYYFWWGDIVGYKWVNNKWVANDGSSSNFSFTSENTPTHGKSMDKLQSEGWITADNVLVPEHDAAHVQWGGTWRMPTIGELSSLNSKCTWLYTTKNGVNGFLISGRGAYSSNSIFLPCACYGNRNRLEDDSYYMVSYVWSSKPSFDSYYNYDANALYFNSSGNHYIDEEERRSSGFPIRPVQSFTE